MPERFDWKPALRPYLDGLSLHPAREAEIIEELSSHLDDRTAELVAGGNPPVDARRIALDDLTADSKLAARLRILKQAHIEPLVPLGDPTSDV